MLVTTKARLQIHFCVLLWGFTGILGKVISLDAAALVWWRMMIVSAGLVLVPRVWKGLRRLPRRLLAIYAGIGVLLTLHWLTFYGSIKLANASVGATCMALGTVFLALIEPRITGRRFDARELVLGIAVVPGVALVVGGIPSSMRLGVVVGVISAIIVAVFAALNKRHVEHSDPLTITFVEIAAGGLFLTILAPAMGAAGSVLCLPRLNDAILLICLALGCTLFPYALSMAVLRHMTAYTMQLAVNLEPVYTILLAIILLGEQYELSRGFYLGVAIILSAVFLHPLLSRRKFMIPTVDGP